VDRKTTSWTLSEISTVVNGELHGPADQLVTRPVPADSNDPDGITFASNAKYLERAEKSEVGAILVSNGFRPSKKPFIVVPDSRIAFGRLLGLWKKPLPLPEGIHPTAVVDALARVDAGASVGAYAVIERGAVVAKGAKVYPFAYIGEDCHVGSDCIVYPHAVLYQGVKLGNRTIVHAGAVLGADGFGFEWDGTQHTKVPQIGIVETGEGVEIGANTCVDRATAGTTSIADGVKLDNLVQVGHNVTIGKHTVIAAQTGLSGSTDIGERVTMGGSVATSHHVQIADDVLLGGRTGVTSDIDEPGEYWGTPARPMLEAMRASLLVYKLPELAARIRELEKRLEELEGK
jgi:UDP-3-O-[3-hydroxymyristoyl] glucosamine N-acyltransferase